LKILITNSGRRTYFIDFLKNLNFNKLQIYLSDTNNKIPTAAQVKKENFLLLPFSNRRSEYKKKLRKFILKNKIDLIIPLSDYDLNILSALQNEMNKKIKFILSNKKVLNICLNKINTHEFLKLNKFDTPKIFETLKKINKYPVVFKRSSGNGSNDCHIIKNKNQIKKFINNKKIYFIQEYINGTEFNLDILNDKNQKFVTCSIKKKILMRAGETDRCEIILDKKIFKIGKRLSDCLAHVGNIDVDLIKRGKKYYIIDINPRFGGGYPFTHLSGMNYIEFLIKNFFNGHDFFKYYKRNLGFYSKGINVYKLNEK